MKAKESDMTDDVIDHEARRLAADAHSEARSAIAAISFTQKSLDEHVRRNEAFEAEIRAALTNILEKVSSGHDKLQTQISETSGRVHGRIDVLIRGLMFGAVGSLVGIVVYAIKQQVGW